MVRQRLSLIFEEPQSIPSSSSISSTSNIPPSSMDNTSTSTMEVDEPSYSPPLPNFSPPQSPTQSSSSSNITQNTDPLILSTSLSSTSTSSTISSNIPIRENNNSNALEGLDLGEDNNSSPSSSLTTTTSSTDISSTSSTLSTSSSIVENIPLIEPIIFYFEKNNLLKEKPNLSMLFLIF